MNIMHNTESERSEASDVNTRNDRVSKITLQGSLRPNAPFDAAFTPNQFIHVLAYTARAFSNQKAAFSNTFIEISVRCPVDDFNPTSHAAEVPLKLKRILGEFSLRLFMEKNMYHKNSSQDMSCEDKGQL